MGFKVRAMRCKHFFIKQPTEEKPWLLLCIRCGVEGEQHA